MIKYNVIKDGRITNSWTSDFADETYYEECFGLPERPELDGLGNPTGKTLPAEYTLQIIDITAEAEQERINAEALKYLADTDWMIIRELDTGTICPSDVKLARAQARAKIVRNN